MAAPIHHSPGICVSFIETSSAIQSLQTIRLYLFTGSVAAFCGLATHYAPCQNTWISTKMCKQFREWQIFRNRSTIAIGKPRSANMRKLLLWIAPAFIPHAIFTLHRRVQSILFIYPCERRLQCWYELMFIFDFTFCRKSVAPFGRRSTRTTACIRWPRETKISSKHVLRVCLWTFNMGSENATNEFMAGGAAASLLWCNFCLDLPHAEFLVLRKERTSNLINGRPYSSKLCANRKFADSDSLAAASVPIYFAPPENSN